MRILLDSKDLIDLLESGKPLSLEDFDAYLQQSSSRIVLTSTNVMELVAPLGKGGDWLHIGSLLRKLETLPACYLREATIPRDEIRGALRSFRAGNEFELPEMYVPRWDDTLALGRQLLTGMLVNFSVTDAVNMLRRYPDAFAGHKRFLNPIRLQLTQDRALTKTERRSLRRNFVDTIGRFLTQMQIDLPQRELTEFAMWIYDKPTRCPGLRLSYLTRNHLLKDRATPIHNGDIVDFAHLSATPYVDAITLDRRMRNYCEQACRTLQRIDPLLNHQRRIFRNLRELITTPS